jgi:hypothetical protein
MTNATITAEESTRQMSLGGVRGGEDGMKDGGRHGRDSGERTWCEHGSPDRDESLFICAVDLCASKPGDLPNKDDAGFPKCIVVFSFGRHPYRSDDRSQGRNNSSYR